MSYIIYKAPLGDTQYWNCRTCRWVKDDRKASFMTKQQAQKEFRRIGGRGIYLEKLAADPQRNPRRGHHKNKITYKPHHGFRSGYSKIVYVNGEPVFGISGERFKSGDHNGVLGGVDGRGKPVGETGLLGIFVIRSEDEKRDLKAPRNFVNGRTYVKEVRDLIRYWVENPQFISVPKIVKERLAELQGQKSNPRRGRRKNPRRGHHKNIKAKQLSDFFFNHGDRFRLKRSYTPNKGLSEETFLAKGRAGRPAPKSLKDEAARLVLKLKKRFGKSVHPEVRVHGREVRIFVRYHRDPADIHRLSPWLKKWMKNPSRRGRKTKTKKNPPAEGMLMGRLASLEVRINGRKQTIKPKGKYLGYLPWSSTLCIMHGPKSMNLDGLSGSVTKLHKQFHNIGPTKATRFTWPDPVGRKTDVGRIVALTYSIPDGLQSPDKKNYLWHHEFGDHGERGHGPVGESGRYPESLMPMLQKDSRGNLFIKRMKGNKFYVTDWLYW